MGKELLIHRTRPAGFRPTVEVVGCFLESAGVCSEILQARGWQ